MFAYLGLLSLAIEDLSHVLYFPTGVKEQLDLLRVEHANVTLALQANMSGGEKCTSTVLHTSEDI